MFEWVSTFFGFFTAFINVLAFNTVELIQLAYGSWAFDEDFLGNVAFNLTLFSEMPIISTNVYDILLMFFSIFYTVVFVVISYKMFRYIFRKFIGAFL